MKPRDLPRVEKLVEQWEPRLRRAFLESIYSVRGAAQLGAIVARLERGDVAGAVEALGLDPARFLALDAAIASAFAAGGSATANAIPALRDADGATLKVVFNIRNPVAEQWLRTESGTLIREIVEDQRLMARNALTAGLEAGVNPRTSALDLIGRINPATGLREGGSIGLTSQQEAWVRNYRAELQTLNPGALDRKLRDARFDASIRKAIERGEPLSAEKIDDIVRAYKNRALRYRGENIARTETLRALNQSQGEATRQAVGRGQVQQSAITKVWVSARDKRTRDTHRAMNGQEVPYEGKFRSPSGALLEYPNDSNAPASETVNCRCTVRYRIDFLRGIR